MYFTIVNYAFFYCFVNDPAATEIYTYRHTRSLHDARPISRPRPGHARLPHGHRRARARGKDLARQPARAGDRSRRLLTRHALRLCSLDTFVAPEMGDRKSTRLNSSH